jgi:meso-butanediol dehydrogenase / (S,S)-butanediol dehydrogenase / diacetyl reductase
VSIGSALFHREFDGRHVVVTGAAGGIGLAIGEAFAEAGASVRLVDLSLAVTAAAEAASVRGLAVTGAVADVTDEEQVKALFAALAQEWSKLDVLVNNAGIITIAPLPETSVADFERVLRVNTTAQFLCAREALPLLRTAGGGSIVNAASGQARQGFIYTPGYAASKFGVVGLTQSLAKELAKDGIRVNAYCPGIVATDMWSYNDREWGRLLGDYQPGELMAKWVSEIPMGRAATPTDIANAVLFLASSAASCITGQALNVDGGMFMN